MILYRVKSKIKGRVIGFLTPRLKRPALIGNNVRINLSNESYVDSGIQLNDNSLVLVWPKPYGKQYVRIGKSVIIGRNSELITHGGHISLGSNVFIGPNCQVQGKGGVVIGNGCKIAAGCFISSSDHDISNIEFGSLERENSAQVTISENVWVGANVTITKGVNIGNNSVIAAGSVVIRDVPANCLVAGVPAEIKRYLSDD
jgi:acetyltransferase-like isoleucine patch superfamily enzyme